MKKIIYKFVDGTKNEVEVNDELFALYQNMEKEEKNKNRAETRRHISLSNYDALPIANDENIEENLIENEERNALAKSILTLKAEEQFIVNLYFYEQKKLHEIAKILNVQKPAVSKKLRRIIKKLKDILAKNGNF